MRHSIPLPEAVKKNVESENGTTTNWLMGSSLANCQNFFLKIGKFRYAPKSANQYEHLSIEKVMDFFFIFQNFSINYFISLKV